MAKKDEQVYIINNQTDLTKALSALAKLQPSSQPWIMSLKPEAEKRRSKQNRLSFMWYNELGKATGHGKEHERCRCKLHHGVPILREDEDFNSWYEVVLAPLTYEQQFMSMEHVDVSSLMSVAEFAQYLTEIDFESADMGIPLTHPDDIYFDALMKIAPEYA